jgi:hypothetical protein
MKKELEATAKQEAISEKTALIEDFNSHNSDSRLSILVFSEIFLFFNIV